MTPSGSTLATQSVPAGHWRQALLGKVMTVGDAVSLPSRDLGPGTSTSAASRIAAAARGQLGLELLTVTGATLDGRSAAAQLAGHLRWGPAAMGTSTPGK